VVFSFPSSDLGERAPRPLHYFSIAKDLHTFSSALVLLVCTSNWRCVIGCTDTDAIVRLIRLEDRENPRS